MYDKETARAQARAGRLAFLAQMEEEERAKAPPSSHDTYGIEQRARRQWEADPALRTEFGGRYESWLAYSKAEARGAVRILGCSRGA